VRSPREGVAHHPLGLRKTRAEQKEPGPSSGLKRGKRNPEPNLKKYNDRVLDRLAWMKDEKLLNANMRARISAGLAEKSWGKHATVWRVFNQFAGTLPGRADWPLSDATLLEFASWCDEKRRLSANTIRSYIQSLSKIQKMKGGPHISVNKVPFLKEFLAGVRHEPRKRAQKRKLIVSFPFLQVLGHWAGKEASWTAFEKVRFWAVCLTSFFASLRIGELLSEKEWEFDPEKTLLWQDVSMEEDGSVRFRIRSPKVENPGGDLVILFRFPDPQTCAASVFRTYHEEAKKRGWVKKDSPVFRSDKGGAWTRKDFQTALDKIVKKTGLVGEKGKVVCHSFRGGIPSALAAQMTPEATAATREWGRWRSVAYKGYTRHHVSLKKKIFERICSLLTHQE
jgi:hypothetical protein